MNLPLSFNALAIEKPGSPVTLVRKTVETLEHDEVLIRVHYASINKMDPVMAQMNLFQLPTPYVLGFDFSGEVVQIGDQGTFKVGDLVFGNTNIGGCFAEYLVAKQGTVLGRGYVPAQDASTFGIAYITAYDSMVIAGAIGRHRGKTIYIAGAAGGVGHFATQIAKLYGLKVIGSASKQKSLELLKKLNVDYVLDYSRQDLVKEILNLTGGRGADVVFDSTLSGDSYKVSTAVVASGGEYIRLGTPSQLKAFGIPDMTDVVEARGARLLFADGTQANKLVAGLEQAVRWYEAGKLKPLVTQVVRFGASELQGAFEAFVAGATNVGKVVVRCGKE